MSLTDIKEAGYCNNMLASHEDIPFWSVILLLSFDISLVQLSTTWNSKWTTAWSFSFIAELELNSMESFLMPFFVESDELWIDLSAMTSLQHWSADRRRRLTHSRSWNHRVSHSQSQALTLPRATRLNSRLSLPDNRCPRCVGSVKVSRFLTVMSSRYLFVLPFDQINHNLITINWASYYIYIYIHDIPLGFYDTTFILVQAFKVSLNGWLFITFRCKFSNLSLVLMFRCIKIKHYYKGIVL